MKAVPYLIQGDNIVLVVNNQTHIINKTTHLNYDKIVEAIKAKKWDNIESLLGIATIITQYSKGNVSIKDGQMFWKNEPFDNALSSRMISMYQEGFDIAPMVAFMENLMTNPSKNSVTQLYGFLEKNNLPITDDGCFLAYKKVRKDYLDIHSGKLSNKIGSVVTMDRANVEDNPNVTCSRGLHFCSQSYLSTFGQIDDPIMILKINPADVVSVPTDYNNAKGRCCKYVVIGQVNGSVDSTFTTSVVTKEEVAPAPITLPKEEVVKKTQFRVFRVSNDETVKMVDTQQEAQALVDRNVRQKKAKLDFSEINV